MNMNMPIIIIYADIIYIIYAMLFRGLNVSLPPPWSFLSCDLATCHLPLSFPCRLLLRGSLFHPPGVDLPADYVAKRCRRCGLLGIFLGSVGFRSSIRSCNGEKRRRLASPLILPCPKKDKSIPGLQT